MKTGPGRSLDILMILVLAGAGADLAPTAMAQGEPKFDAQAQDDIIAKRQTLMEEMYEITNPRQKQAEPAKMQSQAAAINARLAALKSLFPPETNQENPSFQASLPTYAQPAVWQQPAKFAQALEENVKAVDALRQATDPAQLPKLAEQVVQSCEACHSEFRAPYQSPFDVK